VAFDRYILIHADVIWAITMAFQFKNTVTVSPLPSASTTDSVT